MWNMPDVLAFQRKSDLAVNARAKVPLRACDASVPVKQIALGFSPSALAPSSGHPASPHHQQCAAGTRKPTNSKFHLHCTGMPVSFARSPFGDAGHALLSYRTVGRAILLESFLLATLFLLSRRAFSPRGSMQLRVIETLGYLS